MGRSAPQPRNSEVIGPAVLIVLMALAAAACTPKSEGGLDASSRDGGAPPARDAEVRPDAQGASDGGPMPEDAGADAGDSADAGAPDAGADPCELDDDCGGRLHCSGSVGAPGVCRPFPDLATARILVLGAESHWRKSEEDGVQYERPTLNQSLGVADTLAGALTATGYPRATVSASEMEGGGSGRLLDYVYGWTNREAHQAQLEDDWDFVVFFDNYYSLHTSPELMFEAVRVLAGRVRAAGAIPIWVVHSDARPDPDPNGMLCNNRCAHHDDGACGDVHHLSVGLSAATCAYGTDCNDCGERAVADAPEYDMQDLAWRIANAAGSVVVPAGVVASRLDAPYTEWPIVAGAAVFSALTGQNAAELDPGSRPDGLSPARWTEICAEVAAQGLRDDQTVHYSEPFVGAVRIEPIAVPTPYRFMISGTSSERGFAAAMREMLDRENVTYEDTDTGRCSTRSPSVDATCFRTKVLPGFAGLDHHMLYARNYGVSTELMIQESGMPDLMPQLYDRHWDDTQSDGVDALDDVFDRSWGRYIRASVLGIAWLPQHLNFAKLKSRRPSADLLSDGVHATGAVQAGLASMSWTSRTGLSASTAGLEDETAEAIRLGEHTIRTLSALSPTGAFIPDRPEHRRRARPAP